MPVIDADTHLVETEHTWDFMEGDEQQYRPILVTPKGEAGRDYWFIDGKIRGLARQAVTAADVQKLSKELGRELEAPDSARQGENVEVRLEHMDKLGVDVQVLWPTVFLQRIADKPEVEVAVCGSYNRWLADIYQKGHNRLRWIAVLPMLSMPDALDQLDYAHKNGAVGAFFRGIEGDKLLQDPYFFPIYEELSKRNMVVGVHAGTGNQAYYELLSQRNVPGTFWNFRMTAIGAFHSLIMSGIPDMFPNLRWAFVELASQWVPWAMKDVKRRLPQQRKRQLPENPMKAYRMYVACQSDDDIPYVIQYTGEDNMVMGTDYGHHDHAADLEALKNLRGAGGISEGLYQKIVDSNPRALYGI